VLISEFQSAAFGFLSLDFFSFYFLFFVLDVQIERRIKNKVR